MKERPILFSAPMVKALLDGHKTQTRRIVKPQGPMQPECWGNCVVQLTDGHSGRGWYVWDEGYEDEGSYFMKCPYGTPGDRLWVKETWALSHPEDDCGFAVMYHGPIPKSRPEKLHIDFRADQALEDLKRMPWRAAIHMPRWASRITLEITDVRVQRVEDISGDDAIAEGIVRIGRSAYLHGCMDGYGLQGSDPADASRNADEAFLKLFYDINKRAKRGGNPWVWALTFKVVKP